MTEYRVSNIKGSFSFEKTSENIKKIRQYQPKKSESVVQHSNFTVIRSEFVFIIFWSSGYVNVTKIKNFADIKKVFPEFIELTDIQPVSRISIHNIHAFGVWKNNHNLNDLRIKLRRADLNSNIGVSFNPSFFPGLIIRIKNLGTFILFQSGKFAFLGVKSLKNLEKISHQICAVINQLS